MACAVILIGNRHTLDGLEGILIFSFGFDLVDDEVVFVFELEVLGRGDFDC